MLVGPACPLRGTKSGLALAAEYPMDNDLSLVPDAFFANRLASLVQATDIGALTTKKRLKGRRKIDVKFLSFGGGSFRLAPAR